MLQQQQMRNRTAESSVSATVQRTFYAVRPAASQRAVSSVAGCTTTVERSASGGRVETCAHVETGAGPCRTRRKVTTTRLFDREGRLVRETVVEEDLGSYHFPSPLPSGPWNPDVFPMPVRPYGVRWTQS